MCIYNCEQTQSVKHMHAYTVHINTHNAAKKEAVKLMNTKLVRIIINFIIDIIDYVVYNIYDFISLCECLCVCVCVILCRQC